eukprot:m.1212352 g.1212352  ORF g.1212352 m.1212352 type:complete len:140 (-) comp24597_c0_seq46:1928-2347(-)
MQYVETPPSREGPIEMLFKRTVKSWGQHVINMLKLLLVATTNSAGSKSSSIDFACEVNESRDTITDERLLSPLKVAERQREIGRQHSIVIKGVSHFFLLLLKHLNLNHVYQMEHVASKIVLANGVLVCVCCGCVAGVCV